MPRFKEDDIRDAILAILALLIFEGCVAVAFKPAAPSLITQTKASGQ